MIEIVIGIVVSLCVISIIVHIFSDHTVVTTEDTYQEYVNQLYKDMERQSKARMRAMERRHSIHDPYSFYRGTDRFDYRYESMESEKPKKNLIGGELL